MTPSVCLHVTIGLYQYMTYSLTIWQESTYHTNERTTWWTQWNRPTGQSVHQQCSTHNVRVRTCHTSTRCKTTARNSHFITEAWPRGALGHGVRTCPNNNMPGSRELLRSKERAGRKHMDTFHFLKWQCLSVTKAGADHCRAPDWGTHGVKGDIWYSKRPYVGVKGPHESERGPWRWRDLRS